MVDLVFRASSIPRPKKQPQFTESVAIKEGTSRHIDHRPGCRQEGDVAARVVQSSPELWETQKLLWGHRKISSLPFSTPAFPTSYSHLVIQHSLSINYLPSSMLAHGNQKTHCQLIATLRTK